MINHNRRRRDDPNQADARFREVAPADVDLCRFGRRAWARFGGGIRVPAGDFRLGGQKMQNVSMKDTGWMYARYMKRRCKE